MVSCEDSVSVKGHETESRAELLPWVQEAATQTPSSSKNVSVQFQTKSETGESTPGLVPA